jgi:imidazolonepropionase-like amidohydrolase
MPELLAAPRVITGDKTVRDGAVVIGDRTVDWAGPTAAVPAEYAALPRTDYPDSTIMPGLIDSHVHLGFDGGPNPAARMRSETDAQQLVLMLNNARQLLGVGVTTARDLGARAYLDVVVRDAIASDLARGPRLVVAARPVTVTGGHTGSAPWYAQFTTAQLAVIVEEASRVDKPVAAHAHGLEGIRRAVEAGVTTLEHCSFVTETNERQFSEPLAAQIAERNIFVCPTINVNAPYVAKLTGITVGEHAKAMHEMGVRIIAGTDAGIDNTPHHQYVGGLEYLVTLGFEPREVLAMATTEAAAALGVDTITGRLAPGYDADLIVVDGDPQTDIAVLGKLRRVIARGRDYLPDSGRFDVSAPGTPFASPDPPRRSAAARRGDQTTAGLGRAAPAVDDVLHLLPVDIDTAESSGPQVVQLLGERDDEADVIVPAGLLLRRAVQPLGRRFRVVTVVRPLPGRFGHRILGAHRVVVQVPATRDEVAEDLSEQALLSLIGQVVHAHRGHHGIERRRDRRGPVAG